MPSCAEEVIRSRIDAQIEISIQERRATVVFRREADGWRIVHRHAGLQMRTHLRDMDKCGVLSNLPIDNVGVWRRSVDC